jgi:septal ring factor EnvC (AmiA/AmiB activator)
MAVTTAVAVGVGALAAGAGVVVNAIGSKKQNDIARDNLELQKKNSKLNAESNLRDIDKGIFNLESKVGEYELGIREANSRIDSYDKWLNNYGSMYAQETASKQAQTDQLTASGKEAYDNFMNAIGYSDALAGATGRVGAGTSQSHTTGALDRKLVDYVGEDRMLDENGGLYGSQLSAAQMEMQQLRTDLEFQQQEMQGNRDIASSTLADYEQSIIKTQNSITESKAERDSLQQFIADNFDV